MTTRHRSLVERGGRKTLVRDKDLENSQERANLSRKNRYSRVFKKRFEHIEFPAKVLD